MAGFGIERPDCGVMLSGKNDKQMSKISDKQRLCRKSAQKL